MMNYPQSSPFECYEDMDEFIALNLGYVKNPVKRDTHRWLRPDGVHVHFPYFHESPIDINYALSILPITLCGRYAEELEKLCDLAMKHVAFATTKEQAKALALACGGVLYEENIVRENVGWGAAENEIEKVLRESFSNDSSLKDLGLKLGEEAGEVQGAIVKLREKRSSLDELKDEIGDVLIVLSRFASQLNTTLGELRRKRWDVVHRRFVKDHPLNPDTKPLEVPTAPLPARPVIRQQSGTTILSDETGVRDDSFTGISD